MRKDGWEIERNLSFDKFQIGDLLVSDTVKDGPFVMIGTIKRTLGTDLLSLIDSKGKLRPTVHFTRVYRIVESSL